MTNRLKKTLNINIIIQAVFFIALLVSDRATKYAAVACLKGKDAFVLIPGVLEFRYLENSGAAFGIFQNKQWLFYIITFVILAAIVILFSRLCRELYRYCLAAEELGEKFSKKTYNDILFLNYLLACLAAGAVGNLIDRFAQKYVVDFIYVKIIDFPVFNFADICVTVSAVLLVVFFIFIYKDDDNFSVFGKKGRKSSEGAEEISNPEDPAADFGNENAVTEEPAGASDPDDSSCGADKDNGGAEEPIEDTRQSEESLEAAFEAQEEPPQEELPQEELPQEEPPQEEPRDEQLPDEQPRERAIKE